MIRKSSCSTALLMALTFSFVSAALATSVHAQGKWRLGQPIPQGANEVIGAAVGNEMSNTWSRAARMITPRHGFAAGAIAGSIIAVSGVNNAGGAGTLSVVAVSEIFEP